MKDITINMNLEICPACNNKNWMFFPNEEQVKYASCMECKLNLWNFHHSVKKLIFIRCYKGERTWNLKM
jgi:Zn ribbon nucleic-acid-binding protein